MSPAAPPAEPPAAEDRPRVPAVPASSLVLVRPGAGGEISVFTVRRAGTMAFSAHATAFPGGRVDPADDLPDRLWEGTDLADWGRRLGLPHEPADAHGTLAELDPADGAGRVLVSPELRAAGSLEKEVNLLGMGRHFELWDAQIYAAKEQAAIAEGMPEALKNFTF